MCSALTEQVELKHTHWIPLLKKYLEQWGWQFKKDEGSGLELNGTTSGKRLQQTLLCQDKGTKPLSRSTVMP